jgi:hypothetical protein
VTLCGNDADSPKGVLFSCGDALPRKECHRFSDGTLIGQLDEVGLRSSIGVAWTTPGRRRFHATISARVMSTPHDLRGSSNGQQQRKRITAEKSDRPALYEVRGRTGLFHVRQVSTNRFYK